ncbi:hypothetical protein [Woodsholea maritima]|uniref:hypothetical protein n=1 Tax=Woodsholea maritima TaxID=240237 RepID=UPI0014616368|nr:hypothetical protein [Woodsholea maritima]
MPKPSLDPDSDEGAVDAAPPAPVKKPAPKKEGREDRLAAALRANLRRRKAPKPAKPAS